MPTHLPLVRIVPSQTHMTFWSPALIEHASQDSLRRLLANLFEVKEVRAVKILKHRALARIEIGGHANAAQIWKSVGQALQTLAASRKTMPNKSISRLYLDSTENTSLHITRTEHGLSSWRPRYRSATRLRLTHPVLAQRGIALRLEQELSVVDGIRTFRVNSTARSVILQFDPAQITDDAILRTLEDLLPVLLGVDETPPSKARLFAASGLLATAYAAQAYLPALRPAAVAGVAIYSFQNVRAAIQDLRHGRIGLPAMYTFGLALTLYTALPFNSALFAVFGQVWPIFNRRTFASTWRQHVIARRRRPALVRQIVDGSEHSIYARDIQPGDLIRVRAGERIGVDGEIEAGHALIRHDPTARGAGRVVRETGQSARASAMIDQGTVDIRVTVNEAANLARLIDQDAARFAASLRRLPQVVEDRGNRNGRFALAAAIFALLTQRPVGTAQAIIRPDYVIAPRISQELTTLASFLTALDHGILVRDPDVFDRLEGVESVVFDEPGDALGWSAEVDLVTPEKNVPAHDILEGALAAFHGIADERREAIKRALKALRNGAAGTRVAKGNDGWSLQFTGSRDGEDSYVSPVLVVRNGEIFGRIAFKRGLDPRIAALNKTLHRAGITTIYLTKERRQSVKSALRGLGFDQVHAGLNEVSKLSIIYGLGRRTLWIGDSAEAGEVRLRSDAIVAGFLDHSPDADLVFLNRDPSKIGTLFEISRDRRAGISSDLRIVYPLNLAGSIAGYLGFAGSLQAGLLSNSATLAVLLRNWQRLQRAGTL